MSDVGPPRAVRGALSMSSHGSKLRVWRVRSWWNARSVDVCGQYARIVRHCRAFGTVWRRTKLVRELRARLREYYARVPGRVRCRIGVRAWAVHNPAGQRRCPGGARDRSQPSGRAHGVQGSDRDGAASRRPPSAYRQPAMNIVAALRVPQLRQDPVVEWAMRAETLALLGVLNAICASVDRLTGALVEAFAEPARDHQRGPLPGQRGTGPGRR